MPTEQPIHLCHNNSPQSLHTETGIFFRLPHTQPSPAPMSNVLLWVKAGFGSMFFNMANCSFIMYKKSSHRADWVPDLHDQENHSQDKGPEVKVT